ncbi:STAS-like domain-containing protein [Aureispira sp. CCB-E]|uniref:STAS-like domain-containing protein n=1 Tax=Aureispira sp. CCB-E TaxID=3051121 RepID=UPI0028693EDE|nr:STAS-like domain-containing protein [Aureispira sp. CCB-E]WMX17114.1 STAS-like domain-containing protein [Aureispira sp. CCB-E]
MHTSQSNNKTMVTIDIPKDFSSRTGFRTYEDGPHSGQQFFDELLKDKFKIALDQKVKLKIILDGGEGYMSSFLNEAFRRLRNEHTPDIVWNNILIISRETPKYIKKIKDTIYEPA